MDYNSYRAMCEASLEHIKRSEKSIIKTLQNQQKQSMDEKRQRAERNENILRTLERIDSQATALAAKTERLKALKVGMFSMKY
ncbi:CLUMA_CG020757, isoform A [Clunio marinus]|uniref:CLUMA_CG020757, isoform A n=1 Tax=Clunio marinus TaxID=568069 RepID=A0A1J1J5X2_9DIPT|nr:CLUMA_CG020757, isoform A [Clunio marinus]